MNTQINYDGYILSFQQFNLALMPAEQTVAGRTTSIVIASIKIVVYLTFLTIYIIRIKKLDRLASNNFMGFHQTKIFRIKVVLVFLLILISIIHISLSQSYKSYWMYPYRNYSLTDILCIIDYVLQLYIITREYKKKSIKSPSLIAFWCIDGIITFVFIILVVICCIDQTIILFIIKVIILVALIIISFALEEKDKITEIDELRQTINESNLLPVGEGSRKSNTVHKLYIEFNREFQITMNGENMQCSFKIAVYVGEESFIITKSQSDFIELSEELIKIFPQSDEVVLKSQSRSQSTNMMKYGEEKQKQYESYLIQITKTNKFYVQSLMTFLHITPVKRLALLNSRTSYMKKETMNSEEEEKIKKPFFEVEYKKNKIYVSNTQIIQIIVNKTPSEIVQFHNKLVLQKRLKMELLSEEPTTEEFIHFIFRVTNTKYLWRSFSEWMCLGGATEEKIFNMFDFWNFGFKNMCMSINGHEVAFDREGNVINLYLLCITKKNGNMGEGTTLKKRFNEFVKLDKNVRKFVLKQEMKNIMLPSLPPKFSPFGSKTSPKSRQIYFDEYIKQLVKIENISRSEYIVDHCIKLLQFLEVDNEVIAEEFYNFDESYKSEAFGSMNLDELQIGKGK